MLHEDTLVHVYIMFLENTVNIEMPTSIGLAQLS